MQSRRLSRIPEESQPDSSSTPDAKRDQLCGARRRGDRALPTLRVALALTTAALLLGAGDHAVFAASGGSYTLDPSVIAGGGATLSGGSFRLSGTVGQTATATLSASGFSLHDGFWSVQAPATDTIFANGFEL